MHDPADARSAPIVRIRVWDLPTRIFHWLLVALVAASIYTGNVGGLREMDIHMLVGYAVLAVALFRLIWGLIGSPRSRFADFIRGPRTVLRYARDLARGAHRATIGHNPLGGWSVAAMLASLSLQAGAGLFASDDILTEGPLASLVSAPVGKFLTGVHEVNAKVLYALIAVHLGAIAYYRLVHRERLVGAMIDGRKTVDATAANEDAPFASAWRALVPAALCGLVVWALVRYGG